MIAHETAAVVPNTAFAMSRFSPKTKRVSLAGSTGTIKARKNSNWSWANSKLSFSVWLICTTSCSSPNQSSERTLASPTWNTRSTAASLVMMRIERWPLIVPRTAMRLPL
ncbi:hypothetical protein [Altererythrobacter sp. Root672]|uniref:hypothetical protein n=1 Tax=Altererythrobacter sp. Root672 TaxID=1736584 RepID=UPI0019100757|nr:hypothetical protein [Altererythrobacter sp. Root672]